MSFFEAIRSALRALRSNLLRSLLTMLGIVIGVAAVIAMVAVGGGAREQVVAQIRSLGANLLQVWPGNISVGGVRLGAGAQNTLTDDDAAAIQREVNGVQVAAAVVRTGAQIVAMGQNWSTSVQGVDNGFFEAREWEVESGRLFEADEVTRGGQVVILGLTVVQNLFGEGDPIGEIIRVRNVPMTVVGVMSRKGQSAFGQDQDDTIFVPLQTVRMRLAGQNRANARSVNQIMVKVQDGEALDRVQADMRELLRQRHRLQSDQEDDFFIRNLAEIAATREASARTLELLLAAVAAVSLIVGGIGIMNIMLVSVTERTREIGLRLAVGARPTDIRSQFLIEATVLALIGGALGVVLGFGAAQGVSIGAGWPLLVDFGSVGLAVGVSAAIGVFFGWYPAVRAARLDPVEALRAT